MFNTKDLDEETWTKDLRKIIQVTDLYHVGFRVSVWKVIWKVAFTIVEIKVKDLIFRDWRNAKEIRGGTGNTGSDDGKVKINYKDSLLTRTAALNACIGFGLTGENLNLQVFNFNWALERVS